MSDHNDMDDKDDVTNPPKTITKTQLPEPKKVHPKRIMDEGRAALTPPPAKKDERVVR